MKNLSFTAHLIILLSVLSVIFLALAVISSVWKVQDTAAAIDRIEAVAYNPEVRAQIDSANEKYESLDAALHLQSAVTNRDRLTDAKREYASLAIAEVSLAVEHGEPDEVILSRIDDAQNILSAYFTEDEYASVPNYADLQAAAADVEKANGTAPLPAESGGEEEIEIC